VADLVGAMTGRLTEEISPVVAPIGDVLLSAPLERVSMRLNRKRALSSLVGHIFCRKPVSIFPENAPDGGNTLVLRAGAVVGLAGLLGSGADTMLRRLFGIEAPTVVEVRGARRRLKHPRDAIAAGIGMVPGERMLGLVPNQSVRDNILLPNLDVISRIGWLDRKAGDRMVAGLMELIDIRPRRPKLKARALSGGNQQKVILAKWLARGIAVLLLDEPTQGIDVSAKAQIHALIRDFAAGGSAALIKSSDLGELARLCGTVYAIRQHRLAATLDRAAGLDEQKLRSAIGG
jgi:ABC-type sugar transport system ATPase subunit